MGASRARVGKRPPRRGIRLLGQLVRELGPGETARRAGVTVRTLQRWARGGVPAAAREELQAVAARREAARTAALARAAAARKPKPKPKTAREREAERAKKAREAERARKAAEADRKRKALEARAALALRKERAAQAAEKKREEAARKAREAARLVEEARRAAEAKERKRRQEEIRKAKEAQKEAERRAMHEKAKKARDKALAEARRKAEEARRLTSEAKRLKRQAEIERRKREAIDRKEERQKAKEEAAKKAVDRTGEKARRVSRLREACRLFDQNNMGISQIVGVSEATIRRWMIDPPLRSAAWDRLEKSLDEIHTLLALMKVAGDEQKLPTIEPGSGVRRGKKTEGVYWTRLVKRRLSREVVKEIAKWVRSRPGKFFPLWQVVLLTSQFAVHSNVHWKDASPKKTDRDYKTVVVQLGHQKWGDFAVERWEPSPEVESREAAAQAITTIMDAKLESGLVQVYVHSATVWAYRRRSPEEGTSWQSQQRRERGKKWKRKRK